MGPFQSRGCVSPFWLGLSLTRAWAALYLYAMYIAEDLRDPFAGFYTTQVEPLVSIPSQMCTWDSTVSVSAPLTVYKYARYNDLLPECHNHLTLFIDT